MVGRVIVYIIFISGLYVRFCMFNGTSRFVYLQSDLIVTHITLSYIFVHIFRHCIGLFIICKYVSHAT